MLFKKEKDYNYYDYFIRNGQWACKAAEYLHESLSQFNAAGFNERVAQMHEIEHSADSEKHSMMQHLGREFLPPIEREDIVELAQQLDNVVDAIDNVMLRMDMFMVRSVRPEAVTFTSLIIKCCEEMLKTLVEFKNFKSSKTIRETIVAVNTYESEGDLLHSQCIKGLFKDTSIDQRTLFVWTNIYDELEDCLDACEDAVDIIETVIMKNS